MIPSYRLPLICHRWSSWRALCAFGYRCICGNLPCYKGHNDREVLSSWWHLSIFIVLWLNRGVRCCNLRRRGHQLWTGGRWWVPRPTLVFTFSDFNFCLDFKAQFDILKVGWSTLLFLCFSTQVRLFSFWFQDISILALLWGLNFVVQDAWFSLLFDDFLHFFSFKCI